MIIKDARFVISSESVAKCPKPTKPEYAFIGRSNVGKSSLINSLVNHSKLAKTSGKPGKTRLINHFLINNDWYLVDLPGFGFAKASKTERLKWELFIRNYLLKRENLYCLFVLIDIRLEPQQIDLDFMEWLGSNQVPFVITFTKTDKLKPETVPSAVDNYANRMLMVWEELPDIFVTSAETGLGREEILDFIEKTNLK